ncbi:MAG: homoserine dehydrogenase [Chloroflexota bacterium]
MSGSKRVNVGLIGMGTIGNGVATVFTNRAQVLAEQADAVLVLKRIAEKDPSKKPPAGISAAVSLDAADLLNDPEISIVIELIGGEHPALDYITAAIKSGKHVVTANKEVISKHGYDLCLLARQNGVEIRFEASVGGGIPLIAPFQRDIIVNRISAIHAILNGTTNYILTRMAEEDLDFSSALKQAQQLGYAEANPANDVEGIDASYKLAILASLAFHSNVAPEDVYREGISRLKAKDFRYARELGYAIKLLAIAKQTDHGIEVRVHPVFIPEDSLLAKVTGVYNAIQVEGDLFGKVIFYGQGAGAHPTSSAVIADVIGIARNIVKRRINAVQYPARNLPVKPVSDVQMCYYLRLKVNDAPGVLARISKVLGDHMISISSVIQKETDAAKQTAEIVITTHPAREQAMQEALKETRRLEVVKEISNFVRIET